MVKLSTRQITENFSDALLAILYPRACAVCGGSVERRADGCACGACWRATRLFSGRETVCGKCGALFPVNLPADKNTNPRCHRCDAETFTAARAVGVYEGALRAAVLALKREPYLPPRLAERLAHLQRQAPLAQATRLLPVPLSPERQRERGFNQASVIGQALAHGTGLPLDERSLTRTGHTARHRAGMDVRGRRESVADAFVVTRSRLIAGERVLLLDDVFTSGATASACADVLLAAGAAEVSVLTLARAV